MKSLFTISFVLALVAAFATPLAFGAYGGWGGWGWGSALSKDFCPNGDTSGSYYDKTCGKTTSTSTGSTSTGTTDTTTTGTSSTTPVVEEDDRIVARKKKLQAALALDNPSIMDLPAAHQATQRAIDQLMNRWESLDPAVRHEKARLLANKIRRLLARPLVRSVRVILQYVQDRAVLMTTY